MCGLFGFATSAAEPLEKVDVAEALKALRHRGPDRQDTMLIRTGRWQCVLAHARLAIIDLSAGGNQPMATEDGRFTIAYNGEVFNFKEIRRELELNGVSFRSHSDTEAVLKAYVKWGAACLQRFRGFFAFAIVDRDERKLFIARDRLGIKSLYYAKVGGGIAFGSEVRALLASGLVPRKLSSAAVNAYLQYGSVAEPEVIVEGIRSLPAGCYLECRDDEYRETRYWDVPTHRVRSGLSFADAVEALSAELRAAVRLRLISDVPLGVFLSGGVDSSVVVGLAAEASSKPIRTFTVAFGNRAFDESAYAQRVAERFGCEHHVAYLSAERAAAEIDGAVAALDQPSVDGINTYFVAKATREAGITVALSGLGGDELFAGYRHFLGYPWAVRAASLVSAAARWYLRMVEPTTVFQTRNRLSKALAMLAAGSDPVLVYAALRSVFTQDQHRALTPGLENGAAPYRPIGIDELARSGDFVNALCALELTNYMRNTLLRDTDVMSMANSLEVRVPLIDHKVVELAMRLPGPLKLAQGPNKALLCATVPNLPRETVQRKKMGFSLPFDEWFRGPLRPWIEEHLFGEPMQRLGFFEPLAVRALWDGYLRGESYVSHSRVWCLAALTEWAQRNRMSL